MKTAGNWFRRRRTELGETLASMAQLCFVQYQTVLSWELEYATPQISRAQQLADAYQVTKRRMLELMSEHRARVFLRKARRTA